MSKGPTTVKCEFCDMALKSDLEVSKHLSGQTHRDNVKKAIDLHPTDKSSLKDTPSTIVKVFENLRLRKPEDVRDLADKNYFRIPENSPGLLSVADKLANTLFRCICEFQTRNLPSPTRKMLLEVIYSKKDVKEEPKAKEQTTTKTKEKEPPRKQQTQQASPIPTAPQRQTTNPPSSRSTTSERAGSPPLKRRPAPDPKPAPTYTPMAPSTSSSSIVRPTQASNSSANPTPAARQKSQTARQEISRPNRPAPTENSERLVRPNNQGPRMPGPREAPTSQRATNTQSLPTQAPILRNPTGLAAPRPANRVDAPQAQAGRSINASTRPPNQRPPANQANRNPRPPSNLPSPGQMPMAGASFMPRRPIDAEPPPQPRLNSTYQPQLAKIKVEPRDDT